MDVMDTKPKKDSLYNFGFRGWILVIYQAIGYAVYTALTNYPSNVMSQYYGGATTSTLMSLVGTPLGFVINYLILAPNVGKVKSWKKVSLTCFIIGLCASVLIMIIPPAEDQSKINWLWAFAYLINNTCMSYGGCSFTTYIIGNWFPRKRGIVMGISTMAFPIVTGICLSLFMTVYYGALGRTGSMVKANFIAFAPWWALAIIGIILFSIFIKDYPEMVGCYRDNDPSFTKEQAMEMMMKEIENRRTSVWKRKVIWGCLDWYMISLPAGWLLSCAMAYMVQVIPVLYSYGPALDVLAVPGFVLMSSGANAVLFGLAIFALFGSWYLGVIDSKYGPKLAIFITALIMLAAGILGMIHNIICTVAATWLLGLFMGASSNFGLSAVVRYWRGEDFQAVMTGAPPVGMVVSAPLSYVMAALGKVNYDYAFLLITILAVVCAVMNRIFNEKRLYDYDKKLRIAAGKEPDNVLYDRIGMEARQRAAMKELKAAKRG